MLGHLIRKEILDHLLSLRFVILSGIGALIVWLSLFSGYTYYQGCLRDYRLSQAWTESHIQHHVKSGDYLYAGNFGYPVQKPPTPMSIFVRGAEPTLGRTGYIAAVDIRRLKFSPVAEEPILGIFPPLDLAMAVQVVLSLFALLLTYDAVCGEKEGGTLRLTASFPVPRDRLLLGKLIGALIPTLLAFGLPLLLGVGVILLLSDVQFHTPEYARLCLILMIFGLYLAAFTCAGILGSGLTHRAATSFVVLLFFWASAVAVLPRLSLIVADRLRPAISTQRLRADLQALGQSSNMRRFERQRRWDQEYYEKSGKRWWNVPEGRESRTRKRDEVMREEQVRNRVDTRHLEEVFRNRYNARLSLAMSLARFSPAFALNNATVRLAGTGMDRYQRFLDAFNQTRDRLQDWYWNEYMQSSLSWANPDKYGKYDGDLSDIPRVAYRETWPEEDVRAALVDIGMLALWGLVFFIGAHVAMLRYDLR